MFDFLKTVGQGALYLIFSPFILLGVALYSVYAIFLFFFMFIKRIVLFFKGEDMKEESRYDLAAKVHLQNQDIEEEAKQNAINVPATNLVKEQTTIIQSPIIIQTDEQGRIKSVHNVNPNGQLSSTNNANILIDQGDTPSIETRRDD